METKHLSLVKAIVLVFKDGAFRGVSKTKTSKTKT